MEASTHPNDLRQAAYRLRLKLGPGNAERAAFLVRIADALDEAWDQQILRLDGARIPKVGIPTTLQTKLDPP